MSDPAPGVDDRDMRRLLTDIETQRSTVMDAARAPAVARQRADGKMTARERIDALCDAGSWREFGALVTAAGDTDLTRDLDAPADGIVAGLATIEGRPVVVTSHDFTVYGGSSSVIGTLKLARALEKSIESGLPLIRLLEGGGHRIQEGLDARHFASSKGIFNELTRASGWVPVVAAMLGPCFAGPTNHAALADYVVMVRGVATMGMAGPALVKAGTGEDIDKEALGGTALQVDETGMADLAVDSEAECFAAIRRYLSYLPANARAPAPIVACSDPVDRRDEALLDLVPANLRKPYDMRKVVRLLADADSVFEIKPSHARNIVTAYARLDGRAIGFIANNPMFSAGTLDGNACDKAAHFIGLCDAFGLPLIYLVDVPGFAIGSGAERSRMARRSARLIHELGNASVPRICVVLRKGYGLGYVAMNGGRGFGADACFAWPTAEICAMSVEGAVDIAYRKEIRAAPDPQAHRARLIDGFKGQLGALRAAEHFGIDDVIDPRDTRRLIIETLRTAPPRRQLNLPPKFRSVAPI
ncbi:MAG: acyl-CoA carboxylase [Alphaproteobacteria bacterium]|nr:acyl-CoA carboxylase [Alphaproteobacteria bacterium]